MSSLTGQQIKDTYQSLLKTDDNGLITTAFKGITDGSGSTSGLYLKNDGISISGSLIADSITGSLLGNASTATTASFVLTASYTPNYLPLIGGEISGDLTVIGKITATYLDVLIESSSIIFSSGSNILGDTTEDTQTLIGTVIVSGSQQITGSLDVSDGIKGLFFKNETEPTFQNVITTNENIFNHGDLLIKSNSIFIIENEAEYYTLGDITNSGSLIVSGTLIIDGAILSSGPIILAPGTGQIL